MDTNLESLKSELLALTGGDTNIVNSMEELFKMTTVLKEGYTHSTNEAEKEALKDAYLSLMNYFNAMEDMCKKLRWLNIIGANRD